MTDDDIEKGLAICAAATEGPWEAKHYGSEAEICLGLGYIVYVPPERIDGLRPEDLAFIAHTREAYPAALAEVVDQKAKLAEKDAEIERLRALVESAYREAQVSSWAEAEAYFERGTTPTDDQVCWRKSRAKEALR